jgi:protein SSD1
MLQAQQQQMFQNSQYGGMGMLQNQSHIPPGFNNMQFPQMGMNPQQNFQFPPQQNSAPQGAPTQPSAHRRNVSALPAMGAANGPPPAPSSGTAGGNFGEFSMPSAGPAPRRPNNGPGGPPGGAGGHQRRHSLALPEAKRAAELAQQRRGQTGFQFPAPGDASSSSSANTTATDLSTAPNAVSQAVSQAVPAQGNTQNAGGPPRPVRTGHGRSQSLAVGMAGGRPNAGGRLGAFQFPPQSNGNDSGINNNNPSQQSQQAPPSGNVERRGSNSGFQGHARTGSRNYQDNWRTPNQNQQPMDTQNQNTGQFNQGFQPGHRSRASVGGSLGSFQFPPQPNLMMPGATGQGLFMNPGMVNPGILSPQQIAQLQQAALGVPQLGLGLQPGQGIVNQQQQQQQQQQQRKTLFTPYLPQANLPALLGNGHLVSGILRVNKKNRSDAYVSTQDGLLDADIFICGSKDRNRALEGDLVAVELLDVDDVWGQKREKEEKKRRKDVLAGSDGNTRGGSISSPNDAVIGGDSVDQAGQSGGMRRRGSLRQRPTQKKNDDVEVEGQSLLLVEEEEINDEQKPLYAGHVVAVIERVAGQMFSG